MTQKDVSSPGKSTIVFRSDHYENLLVSLAILNSRVINFYLKEKYSSYSYNQGVVFSKEMINNFPLPNISKSHIDDLINLVSQVLYLKKVHSQADTSHLESQIDQLVYELYKLTPEEIEIIEGNMRK